MKYITKSVLALTITALTLLAAGAAHALTSQTSQWDFDQISTAYGYLANNTDPSSPLIAPSNWSGSLVSGLDGSENAVYFPGWTQLINGNQVDATASSLSVADDAKFNASTGSSFTMSAYVNALDPSALVNSGVMVSHDTLNIMQKGLSGGKRQQWKLSVNVKGQFICAFRGPNASGSLMAARATSNRYAFGVTRHVTCGLGGGVITLSVDTAGQVDTYKATGPVSVSNTSDITVGKKPGSTYPGDTFAGTLDDIVITKVQ